jgi:serine/threonine-protein kinase
LRDALRAEGRMDCQRALGILREVASAVEAAHRRNLVHRDGGAVVGTFLYMAPEQLRGDAPSPTWDLWALAVIAFEMVCGSHPFASATFVRDMRVGETSVDERLAHVPSGFRPFFASALALDRDARPASAAALLAGFQRALA